MGKWKAAGDPFHVLGHLDEPGRVRLRMGAVQRLSRKYRMGSSAWK